MAILALGISHRRASVDLLERLAFADPDLAKAFRRAADDPAIDEAVVLSTCNRVEIYGSVPAYHSGFQALKRLLCETRAVDPDEIAEPLYSRYEEAAVEHLLSVAAGLDSMVLGEPQILSQVREAHRRAAEEVATGPALTPLFHTAVRTGRRVRSETGVGAAPDTFVDAGTDLAAETIGGVEGKRAVVVGAGQMATLAVKHLRSRGIATVRVVSRNVERARSLAERTTAEHGPLDSLPEAIALADLVVSATGAAGTVVAEDAVRAAMRGREGPLFLLDLAVPRDVEPEVGSISGVTLVDLEGLRSTVAVRRAEAAGEIEKAHAIVRDEARRFVVRRRSERLAPLFQALRRHGDEIVRAELLRFRSDLASLTDEERAAVEALARGVVAKLLHEPTVRLKERAARGADPGFEKLVAELFDLRPSGDDEPPTSA